MIKQSLLALSFILLWFGGKEEPEGLRIKTIVEKGSEESSGFIKRTEKCIGSVVTEVSDGSVLGSASAIGCMIFSGYCAAGIAVGCAMYGAAEAITLKPVPQGK